MFVTDSLAQYTRFSVSWQLGIGQKLHILYRYGNIFKVVFVPKMMMSHSVTLITMLFVEQPLATPGLLTTITDENVSLHSYIICEVNLQSS